MLANEGQDQVGRNGGNLVEPGFPELALDIVFLCKTVTTAAWLLTYRLWEARDERNACRLMNRPTRKVSDTPLFHF